MVESGADNLMKALMAIGFAVSALVAARCYVELRRATRERRQHVAALNKKSPELADFAATDNRRIDVERRNRSKF